MTWRKRDGRSLIGAHVPEPAAKKPPTRVVGKRGPPISRPKAPKPWRSKAYLAFVRTHPCVFQPGERCVGPVEAHHHGKHPLGQKTDDSRCVPLCREHHREVTDDGFVMDMVGIDGSAKLLTAFEIGLVQVNLLVEWIRTRGER